MKYIFYLAVLLTLFSCQKDQQPAPAEETMYYPPAGSSTWETKSISSLGWNTAAVQPLKDYLQEKNTKSFMILVNGRIVKSLKLIVPLLHAKTRGLRTDDGYGFCQP